MVVVRRLLVEGEVEEAQGFGESRFAASRAGRWMVGRCLLYALRVLQ